MVLEHTPVCLTSKEYRNRTITRLSNNNPRHGCYLLAVLIFSFGILRDSLYHQALADQPRVPLLPEPFSIYVPMILFFSGQLFVITSTWALGITGTFLGDYFGILMDHRVVASVMGMISTNRRLTFLQLPFQCSRKPNVRREHPLFPCYRSLVREASWHPHYLLCLDCICYCTPLRGVSILHAPNSQLARCVQGPSPP